MTQRRMTVHDAARALGISEDAVRMRVKRGTLEAEREAGRLYVMLDTGPTTDPTDRTNELLAELRDRVRSLEDQLGEERRANDENRRLLLAALERIPPQLEAPRDTPPDEPGAAQTATAQPGRVEPQAAVEGEQTATDEQQGRGPVPDTEVPQESSEAEPRSWWQRMFGG